jgi:hypothetical protein
MGMGMGTAHKGEGEKERHHRIIIVGLEFDCCVAGKRFELAPNTTVSQPESAWRKFSWRQITTVRQRNATERNDRVILNHPRNIAE